MELKVCWKARNIKRMKLKYRFLIECTRYKKKERKLEVTNDKDYKTLNDLIDEEQSKGDNFVVTRSIVARK